MYLKVKQWMPHFILHSLCMSIARVRPEMWRDWKFFLLHNNAHLHTAAIVQQFLAKKGVAQLSRPPYLSDLSPPLDYFAFPKLKWELKGDHYASIEDIQKSVTAKFKVFPMSDFGWAKKQLEDRVECQETISNITYLNFLHCFHHFCSVVAKLTRHTIYKSQNVRYSEKNLKAIIAKFGGNLKNENKQNFNETTKCLGVKKMLEKFQYILKRQKRSCSEVDNFTSFFDSMNVLENGIRNSWKPEIFGIGIFIILVRGGSI